jgi:hypothetical protein
MPYPEALGPSSIAISSATSAFMGFLPKFQDVRRAEANDDGMRKDIKLGMIAAVSVSMGIGIIVSNLTGSPYPAIVTFLMCLVLAGCYQAALRSV